MNNIATMVLGGGRGMRLYPLTKFRSKPAVPLAGKYRLDRHPAVELHQQRAEPDLRADAVQLGQPAPAHPPARTTSTPSAAASSRFWPPSRRSRTPTGTRARPTPCGRTCATSQQPGIEYVLILSGDQLYRMDFSDMLRHAPARPRPT